MAEASKSVLSRIVSVLLAVVGTLFTAFLAILAAMYFPSLASLAFGVAALLACPIKAVRNIGPLKRLWDALPRAVPALLSAVLLVVGSFLSTETSDESVMTRSMNLLGVETPQVLVADSVEYSTDSIDVYDYITCDDEEAELTVHDDIVASKVGEQQIEVEVKKGLYRQVEDVTVAVKDTQAPEIEIAQREVSVEMGEEFDPLGNVASVTDPVDGELQMVDAQPTAQGSEAGLERFYDAGWYYVSGDFDVDAAGTYPIVVTASDQHGNEATEEFTLTVTDPLADAKLTKTTTVVEYAKGEVDPTTLVKCSDDRIAVSAKPFKLSEIGAHKVDFELALNGRTRAETRTFKVQDAQAPVIRLKKKTLTREAGVNFAPTDVVKAVSDPVDGALKAVTQQPKAKSSKVGLRQCYKRGWYLVSGTYDLSKAGSYELTVTAADKFGNKTTKKCTLVVTDPLAKVKLNKTTSVLEYAQQELDPAKLVKCSDERVSVTAAPLDLREIGAHKVEYTLTLHGRTRTETRTFKVRDTKSPVINLQSEGWEMDAGGTFDAAGNVLSASDPVDGELPWVDYVPGDNGDGWYTVEGSFDAYTPGMYYFTAIACDRNGNQTKREFSLRVKEAPVVVDAGQESDQRHTYMLNTNSHKFHILGCNDIDKMSDSNKWEVYMTRDEVLGMGYVPCGHCDP